MIANDVLYSREDKPFGKSWEGWTINWCRWLFSIPADRNPALDRSGQHSAENQISHDVWFLAGSSELTMSNECIKRTSRIESGRSIFFPVVVALCSNAEEPNLNTEEKLRSRANAIIDKLNSKNLDTTIDDMKLEYLEQYRIQCPLFTLDLPGNNIIKMRSGHTTEGTTMAIADGYWIFIRPLPSGSHTIHFGLEDNLYEDYTLDGEVTYTISVE